MMKVQGSRALDEETEMTLQRTYTWLMPDRSDVSDMSDLSDAVIYNVL